MNPDGQIDRRLRHMGRFQNQKGKRRGHIRPVRRRAANLVISRIIDEQAGQNKLRLFVRQNPGSLVPLVIRLQRHVQLSARSCAVVGPVKHIEPCDPLAGFPEGLGRAGENMFISKRHFLQIPSKLRVRFSFFHFTNVRYCASHPAANAQKHFLLGVIKPCRF